MSAAGRHIADDVEIDDGHLARIEGIIRSMTPDERRNPRLMNGSRKRRIAQGSGTSPQEVNALLKQFNETQKMMKSFAGGKGVPGLPNIPGLTPGRKAQKAALQTAVRAEPSRRGGTPRTGKKKNKKKKR